MTQDQGEPDRSAISDNDLLRSHLEGDSTAFADLVRRYQKDLYAFLARFTGDPALAEDVFQETFLQLHQSAAGFDLSRRLKPWLFTIAANKARDALRSRSRKQAAPLDATIGKGTDESTFAALMPGIVPAPDESMTNLETRQAVQSIVQGLPEHLRSVLVLSYFHEMPYKEIAEVLDIPLGTVKSRLHAAVAAFARKWKEIAERLGHTDEHG